MGQPLSPEKLVYGAAQAGDPQVSPDGASIVYAVTRHHPQGKHRTTSTIWTCGIDGSAPRQLTFGPGRDAGARWSPDGSQLAFISDRVDRSGIFVLPFDGGEARQLTRHQQPVDALAWSPDGWSIAYTAPFDPQNPGEMSPPEGAAPAVRATRRIDYKQDNRADGYLGDVRSQVYIVDVTSGERRMLTHEPVDHHHPRWSPDGRRLAAQIPALNGMVSRLGLIDVASGATTLVGPERGVVGLWEWSPAGDRILFAGEPERTFQLDLFVHDVASGESRCLTDGLQCLPDAGYPTRLPPSQPVWLDDRRALIHAMRAGASGLYVVDTESGEVAQEQTWQATNSGLSVDRSKRYVVQGHASFERLGEISVFDRSTGAATVVTDQSAALLGDAPAAGWERVEVRREPYTIEGWLLRPADFDPAKRYPVVLDVHGGPNGSYGHGFNLVQQLLATNGFLVVIVNPRGSSSYGREFTQQVTRDWGGEDYQDLMAILDAVLERPEADAARTGIYGFSYGGFMTAWAIGQSDRFQAAVCGAPVFAFASFYGTSDIGHIFGDLQWGGPPWENLEWCTARSPSTHAQRIRTPTLILHGEADQRCPIGQGEEMFVALSKAGCEVEFVRYPGASHLFLGGGHPEHRVDFLSRTLAWFKGHLGEPA